MIRALSIFILCGVSALAQTNTLPAQPAGPLPTYGYSIAWSAAAGQVAGYRVYWAYSSNALERPVFAINVGNTLAAEIRGFTNREVYFAVRAYDATGTEGLPSNTAWVKEETTVRHYLQTNATLNSAGWADAMKVYDRTNDFKLPAEFTRIRTERIEAVMFYP